MDDSTSNCQLNHGEVDSISDCQLNHGKVYFKFKSNEVPELVPKVGIIFRNLEDATKFYNDYTKAAGLLYPVKPLLCYISGASKFQPISNRGVQNRSEPI
ncbi:hypothetical protein AHAS_Ahas05G0054700 [Arachis hypogaea]